MATELQENKPQPGQQTAPKPAAKKGAQGESKPVRESAASTKENAKSGETRKDNFKIGIPGVDLKEIERNVPVDEPPQMPLNAELRNIGKRFPRVDGPYKVSGTAKYPSDVNLPGMLYAHFHNSPVPHAHVLSVDTSAASSYPGVKAVHVLEKMLGAAELKDKSEEKVKYPVVRFAGQPIAAVAAVTPDAAAAAAKLIKVQYEPLPFVTSVDAARASDAPLVFPGVAAQAGTAGGGGGPENVPQTGNVRGPEIGGGGRRVPKEKGDATDAFTSSEVKVEGKYQTQVQTHSALETHGVLADWKDAELTVYASTQSTLSVRDELAEVFELPKSKVRVLTDYMGGGFGAKFGAGNPGVVAAHLSKKAGAPVRLFLTRKEEHLSVGNRPDSHTTIQVGASKDGKLQAIHYTTYGTAGVGTGAGSAGPAQNMYDCPNVRTEEYDVFINAGPSAAFRAPGHPQGCFAVEQAMDELAEKLTIDPVELRDRNDLSPARRAERKIGVEKFGWANRKPKNSDRGPVKRGVGFAQSVWYRINSMDSGCEVRIHRDGSVEAFSAVQDIGGGIRTVLAQLVAEELGLEPRQVQVKIGDTNSPPGPPSGGSMTTGSITPAVRNAAYKVKQKFLQEVATSSNANAGDLKLAEGKVILPGGKSMTFRQAASKLSAEYISAQAMRTPEYGAREAMFLGGVQFVEANVDTETGVIRVDRVVAVHDCGRPMNLLTLESQVNGGILQGISFALYEERKLDRNTGVMVNPNLEQYKIVGAQEVPQIEVHFIEDYLARSSTDAGGIGEPATIPTSAAIANAVYNATGVRMRQLPMTPARVLQALATAGGAQ